MALVNGRSKGFIFLVVGKERLFIKTGWFIFLLLNNQMNNYCSPKDSDHPSPWNSFHIMLRVGKYAVKIKVLRKGKVMLLLLFFKCITDKCCLKKK